MKAAENSWHLGLATEGLKCFLRFHATIKPSDLKFKNYALFSMDIMDFFFNKMSLKVSELES